MTILSDFMIREWAKNGGVSPFDRVLINPASIDLRLGNLIRVPHWYWRPGLWRIVRRLNLPKWSEAKEFTMHLLKPGDFVLCHSLEYVKIPTHLSAALYLKSTPGRDGAEHNHAGWAECGFEGQLTFELTNTAPWGIELRPNDRLIQLVMVEMSAVPERDYRQTGRYSKQTGPTPARLDKTSQ